MLREIWNKETAYRQNCLNYILRGVKTWKQKCVEMGIHLIDTILYTISFADYQVVIAQDYHDPNLMSKKLITEFKMGKRSQYKQNHNTLPRLQDIYELTFQMIGSSIKQ